METVADRIKLARLQAGLTQESLGKSCGVSRAAVSQWEAGTTKSPTSQNIFAIARATGFDAEWLSSGRGQKTSTAGTTYQRESGNADWTGVMEPWGDETPLSEDEVEIKMFTEVEIQGGDGSSHAVEFSGPVLRFSKRTLAKANVPPEAAGCAKVSGNSMEPVMPEGTTVGVNTADTTIRDGKVFAVDHHGHLRVKLLYRLAGGGIRLASYNRDEYPDEHLSPEEVRDNVRIIGRVFWWSVLD